MIGILSTVLIARLDPVGQINKAKDAQRQHDLTQIKTALDTYYNDHNRYPETLAELTLGNQPYIKALPKDPSTGSDYVYALDNANPQWDVLFTKLSRVPSNQNSCPVTSLPSCPQYNATWGCTMSGKVDCTYLTTSFTLPDSGILPTSVPAPPTSTPTPTPAFARVFVTSTKYTGDLKTAGSSVGLGTATDGLDGADKICQARANAANRGGTWKAWLSTTTTSPSTSFNKATVPYKLLNGNIVAQSWNDLATPKSGGIYLTNPIKIDEFNHDSGDQYPWTATHANGQWFSPIYPYNCSNWTSAQSGCAGSNVSTNVCGVRGSNHGSSGFNPLDQSWTVEYFYQECSSTDSLYCFEQIGPTPTLIATPTGPTATPTQTPTPTPTTPPFSPCASGSTKVHQMQKGSIYFTACSGAQPASTASSLCRQGDARVWHCSPNIRIGRWMIRRLKQHRIGLAAIPKARSAKVL